MSGDREEVASVSRCNGAYMIVLNEGLPRIEDMTVWEFASCASSLAAAKRVAREMVPGPEDGFRGPVRWIDEGGGNWHLEMTVGDPDEEDPEW